MRESNTCDSSPPARGCNLLSSRARVEIRDPDEMCFPDGQEWKARTAGNDVMNAVNVRLVRCIPIMLATCSLGILASIASAQGDPQVGTWELNLAPAREPERSS